MLPADPSSYPILVVDDEPDNLDAFRFNFRRVFQIHTAGSGDEALQLLKEHDVAVIVTDQRMPRMTGLEFLKAARAVRPDAVGIILTAFTDVDVLIESINLGHVYRYITKPWDAKEVKGVLTQALERYHLRRDNAKLREQLEQYAGYLNQEMHGEFDFGQIIGDAPALREVLTKVEQVAPTHSTVLLRGETGTGKELVAHAIHINSPREGKPFVRVNCAALAAGVLEVGAVRPREGRVHRRRRAAPGPLRARRRRHALPRRVRRHADGGAGQAPARAAGARVRARRRARRRSTSTCASSRRRTATWRR